MIPSPRDILLRRIELHRYYREPNVVRELSRRLHRLDRTGRWPPVVDCSPLARSLVDLDMPLRFCRRLERFGIVYASELAPWTPERLKLLVPRRGDELVASARAALASVGLSLGMSRFSTLGHRQAPLTAWLVRRRHRKRRRLSSTRRQLIVDMLAEGLSEREISRRLGYRSHTTVWAVKRELRLQRARQLGQGADNELEAKGSVLTAVVGKVASGSHCAGITTLVQLSGCAETDPQAACRRRLIV